MGRDTGVALKLGEIFARVEEWPEDAQDEAVRRLEEIKSEFTEPLSSEDIEAVERGLEDVRQGRVVSMQEIRALVDPYRGK